MTGGITIDLSQFEPILKKFSTLSQELQDQVDEEFEEGAREFVALAKKEAPGDQGRLAGAISYERKGIMNYEIFAQTTYAAYMEFGTKKKFRAIPGVDSSAYKGKGTGDYFEFLNAILDWVKRKGIGGKFRGSLSPGKVTVPKSQQDRLVETAEAIAYSIIRHGVKPHPFFFKQQIIVVPKTVERIKNAIEQTLSK